MYIAPFSRNSDLLADKHRNIRRSASVFATPVRGEPGRIS